MLQNFKSLYVWDGCRTRYFGLEMRRYLENEVANVGGNTHKLSHWKKLTRGGTFYLFQTLMVIFEKMLLVYS